MMTYEPKENLNIDNLLDTSEYDRMLETINNSSVSDRQKEFLRLASTRFIRFNYAKIADYHSCTTQEMKDLIEDLHLVVVDSGDAIEHGFFEYFEGYDKLVGELISE